MRTLDCSPEEQSMVKAWLGQVGFRFDLFGLTPEQCTVASVDPHLGMARNWLLKNDGYYTITMRVSGPFAINGDDHGGWRLVRLDTLVSRNIVEMEFRGGYFMWDGGEGVMDNAD